MRFDYRGMGDSEGERRTFEDIDPDIHAAIDAFVQQVPSIERIVLWGLCDAASAACLYAPTDPRVTGLVLANPWVHTEATQAETYLRHYYVRRITEPAFWKKILSGKFSLTESARSFQKLVQASVSRDTATNDQASITGFRALPFPQSMAGGLAQSRQGCADRSLWKRLYRRRIQRFGQILSRLGHRAGQQSGDLARDEAVRPHVFDGSVARGNRDADA